MTTTLRIAVLVSTARHPVSGQPVSLDLEVSGGGPAYVPTGTVTVYDNGVAIGTAALSNGRATFARTFLTGGHAINGRSTWYQDAWRVAPGKGDGFTWDNRNTNAAVEREPDRRIDYIFSGWSPDRPKGAGRVAFSAVVCDRALTGAFASDHFGLFAEIEVP